MRVETLTRGPRRARHRQRELFHVVHLNGGRGAGDANEHTVHEVEELRKFAPTCTHPTSTATHGAV